MFSFNRPLAAAALVAGCFSTAAVRADNLFPPPPANVAAGPAAAAGDASILPSSRQARAELAKARLDLMRAKVAAGELQRSVEAEMRGSATFLDLQRAALTSRNEFNAARGLTLDGVRRNPAVVRLLGDREAARASMRRMADQHRDAFMELAPLARRAMEAGVRVTRAESIALALNPAVEEARQAMTEAFARLRLATKSNRDALLDHPGLAMARDEVDAAKARVAEANRRLAEALTAEANAERPALASRR